MSNRFSSTSGYCPHTSTITKPPPSGSEHYAKLICAACGEFIKFLPKPQNVERRKLNGYRLAKLAMCPGLNDWERSFIDDLTKIENHKLTPKQQAAFDRICADYLSEGRAA